MIHELLKIAIENPEGFTVRLPELTTVKTGVVSAYLETQDSFGIEGLKTVVQHASAHDEIVGGWMFDGKYYFDSCKVFTDREEAIKFGKEQKQIAIFDLDNLELIKL